MPRRAWLAALFLLGTAADADEGPAPAGLDELAAGSARAAGIVAACRAEPPGCADAEARGALARAFYTLILHDLVHGRPVDGVQVANVRTLDPELYARLPQLESGAPAAWVADLDRVDPVGPPVAPAAPSPPTPGTERPEEPAAPEPEPVDPYAAALEALERGDALRASALLLPLTRTHPDARLHLSRAVEKLGLPAASLVLRIRWLRGLHGEADPRVSEATRDAVRLAVVAGSRQPLVDLAEAVHPRLWHRSVRADGWLALGQGWQARGDLSPALKAFSEVDTRSAPYARGEYQTGVIYLQTGQPWEAIGALGNAWEAREADIDGELVREMALWRMAELYEGLQRPDEAYAVYEALAIATSPLSDRARLACARIAADRGDGKLARTWLGGPSRGVFSPERALVRSQVALTEGRDPEALAHLDRAEPALRELSVELRRLSGDLGGLWARLHAPDRNPVLAARLDADPTLAAHRAHLAALAADRKRIAAHPDEGWRRSVGRALDHALLSEERAVRSRATADAYTAVVDLQRELGELDRTLKRLRSQVER